jgi:hypothetical protein
VDNFISIDEHEIRYWVLEVPTLSASKDNPDLLKVLKSELLHFMYFLNKRKIKSPKTTRMWFKKEQIYTDSLARLVRGNRTYICREIEEILIDDFIKFDVAILKYTLGDLLEKLSKNNIRSSSSNIREKLKSNFNLESVNGSYVKYELINNLAGGFSVIENSCKGRYFAFSKSDFIEE